MEKITHISAKQYFRDQMSKQSDRYICKDDLYRHYTAKCTPYTLNTHIKTENKNMDTMLQKHNNRKLTTRALHTHPT